MEHLSRIRSRIESISGLGELVNALRAMAASHTREAQEALRGTDRYRDTIAGAMAAALAAPGAARALASAGDGAAGAALVAICSEHGFVGGFNDRLIARAARERAPGERLFVVGRRGLLRAAELRLEVDADWAMVPHPAGVPALAGRLSAALGAAGGARLLFAGLRPGARSEPEIRTVLPVTADRFAGRIPPDAPLLQLPADRLLPRLAREFLFAEIAHVLMETLASENAARLRTMESASRNIEDKLDSLRRTERITRQEEITADLLDVVTGAEAVRRADPPPDPPPEQSPEQQP